MAGLYQTIRAALTRQLDARWPTRDVLVEVNPTTGEAVGPDGGPELPAEYFFVDITPLGHTTQGGRFTSVSVLVSITAQTRKRLKSEYFPLIDELDEMFRPVFRFGERAVTVNASIPKIEDGLLHYGFSFTFTPDQEELVPEDAELMSELAFSINDEEWRP